MPADNVEEGIKSFDPSRLTALLSDWCRHGVGYILLHEALSLSPKAEQISQHPVLSFWMARLHGGVKVHSCCRG